jgi:hypothetical protein
VLKPKNSVQWYGEVFGWMGRYIGGTPPAQPVPATPAAAAQPERGE